MAVGADFHADIALMGGSRLEAVAASAFNVYLFVSWMNPGFHFCRTPSEYQSSMRFKSAAFAVQREPHLPGGRTNRAAFRPRRVGQLAVSRSAIRPWLRHMAAMQRDSPAG